MKDLTKIIAVIVVTGLFMWGGVWLAKNGSYFFFYEEMVKETIQEMVKSGALK